MGGRGSVSKTTNQISIEEIVSKEEVKRILIKSEELREWNPSMDNSIGVGTLKLKKCPCCETYSIPINTLNYECRICGWIFDEYQNSNLDSLDGLNKISLKEAKHKWRNKRNFVHSCTVLNDLT